MYRLLVFRRNAWREYWCAWHNRPFHKTSPCIPLSQPNSQSSGSEIMEKPFLCVNEYLSTKVPISRANWLLSCWWCLALISPILYHIILWVMGRLKDLIALPATWSALCLLGWSNDSVMIQTLKFSYSCTTILLDVWKRLPVDIVLVGVLRDKDVQTYNVKGIQISESRWMLLKVTLLMPRESRHKSITKGLMVLFWRLNTMFSWQTKRKEEKGSWQMCGIQKFM